MIFVVRVKNKYRWLKWLLPKKINLVGESKYKVYNPNKFRVDVVYSLNLRMVHIYGDLERRLYEIIGLQ